MRKVTEDELIELVGDEGTFEKEHRKGSTFYAHNEYTFTQKDIDDFAEEGIDASEFLNVSVVESGIWSDDDGFDLASRDWYKNEPYEVHVPEVVIPAHTKTEFRSTKFDPVFE